VLINLQFLLFVKSHSQQIPKMSFTRINARMDTPNLSGLSQLHKGPGEFAKQTCVGKVSHHFELELNTLGF
jgi:hypothetical protein